jgi:hypothetical protein
VADHFRVNRNDLFFILKNQLHYGSLCSLARYKDFKEEMLDMVVTEAITLATEVVDPLQWASYTFPALMCFGDATMAWRLLDLAIIAQRIMTEGRANAFYEGKVMQASYFVGTVLPLTMARLDTCIRSGREIGETPNEAF